MNFHPPIVHCPKCGCDFCNLGHNDIDIEYGFCKCKNCGFKFDKETLGMIPSNHLISLKLPKLPKTLSTCNEDNSSFVKLSIADIDYSYIDGFFHFTISGKKLSDEQNGYSLDDCKISWAISNNQKKIFESACVLTSSLFAGDEFSIEFGTKCPIYANKDMVLQFSLIPIKKQEEQQDEEDCNCFEFGRLWDDTLGIRAVNAIKSEEIIIPEEYGGYKVSTILANGFNGQTNLKSVSIPSSVKRIETGAFCGCINLKNIKIAENVESIADNAFENCCIEQASLPITLLNKIDLSNIVTLELTKGNKYGYLCEDRISGRFSYVCQNLEKLVIDKGIKSIDDYAFYQCEKLQSISLPENIRIGKGAFCACPAIDELIIPAGVEICDSAFSQSKIKKLIATKKTSYIWNDSFSFAEIEQAVVSTGFINSIKNCDIYELEIRGTGKSIYGNPFVYGNHLSKLIISPNVIELDENVFKRCPIKNASFSMDVFEYIPKENLEIVEILRGNAILDYEFSDCEKLKEVIIDSSVGSVADYAFSGCPIETAIIPATYIGKIPRDNLRFITLHSGTTIKDYAFSGCELLEKIELPNSIMTIGKSAFSGCRNLTNIILPHSIISIDEYAFSGCEKLEEIILPPNITAISNRMFENCYSLKNIDIHSNICSIGERAFDDCKELSEITILSTVKDIGEEIFYGCEKLEILSLPFVGKDENDETSTLEYYYGYSDSISSLRKISIQQKVVRRLFDLFSKNGLEEVVIGKNVEDIAISAFECCSTLKRIIVEDGNLYYHTKNGCLIHTESKTLLYACENAIIPADGSVCIIENGACCSFFPPHIPQSITKIKRGAFDSDVHFDGCLKEWQSIEKEENWNLLWDGGYATVFCNDGKISKIKE